MTAVRTGGEHLDFTAIYAEWAGWHTQFFRGFDFVSDNHSGGACVDS